MLTTGVSRPAWIGTATRVLYSCAAASLRCSAMRSWRAASAPRASRKCGASTSRRIGLETYAEDVNVSRFFRGRVPALDLADDSEQTRFEYRHNAFHDGTM